MKTTSKLFRVWNRLFFNIFRFVLVKINNKIYQFKGPNFSQVYFVFYVKESKQLSKAFDVISNLLKNKQELHIVDVGSNIGWMALYMNHRFENNAKFSLIEPIPQNLIYLENNTKMLNRKIYKIGVSNNDTEINIGTPAFKSNDTGLYSIFNKENICKISCDKLDNILINENNIDLIKIDVEGMELDVLQSAKNILIKFKPILFFEVNKNLNNNYESISEFLESIGYREFSNQIFTPNSTFDKFDVIWLKE
jgi:FkbM family methyltransferase